MSTPRRSQAVALGITAVLAAGLSGCGSDAEYDFAGVCVDKQTQVRVDDEQCDDNNTVYRSGGYGWYFIPLGTSAASVGSRVTGGTYSDPGTSASRGGVSRSGGTVARGGFGGGDGGSGS